MKSPDRLKSEYMCECARNGITKIEDIHNHLKEEISAKKRKLQEVEPLRLELRNLQKVEEKIAALLNIDAVTTDFDDDNEESKRARRMVVNLISNNAPMSNREIILKFVKEDPDSYGQDEKIIRAIKWLAERSAVEKNDERQIVKGPKWDKYS